MNIETVFEHPLFQIEAKVLRSHTLVRMRTRDWTNVLPITHDGRAVLVRQYRFGTEETTLEVPGGIVDPGERPRDGAARELREETGYSGGEWEELGFVHPNPAIQTNRCHLYIARGVSLTGAQDLDATEDIAVELHPVSALGEMVTDGRITHALAVVTIQRYLLGTR